MTHSKLRWWLIILIYLAAHGFFNPFGLVSDQLSKSAFYGLSSIALALTLIKRGNRDLHYPRKSYMILLVGILVSSLMASWFHPQSLSTSFVAILPYFFGYLYFYFLVKYNISADKLENLLRILTICSLIMYLANLVSFPNKIFGESMAADEYDMSRGFARIGVPMIEIVVTYFLFCINRWLQTKRRAYVVWIVITMVLIFMSLTRQVIAMSAILGLLFIMKNAKFYKKIIVVATSVLFVYYVLPTIPIFQTMIELSENQALQNDDEEDVRIRAWRFYTTEYQTNHLTPFFGNGMPSIGNSIWGDRHLLTVSSIYGGNGCYYVDVGWAGFFWLFGGISTLCLLIMFVSSIKTKKRTKSFYINYSLLFFLITSVASGPIVNKAQIVSLCILFYLAFNEGVFSPEFKHRMPKITKSLDEYSQKDIINTKE